METRYYSESGPSGEERKLALHVSKEVFGRITGHLNRKAKLQEEIDKEAAHKSYLRESVKAMTADWDNSIENLRKKKEKARQLRLAEKADVRVEQYNKVIKQQAEQRQKYNEEMARKIFITSGDQKELNSSLLLSECLYANEKLLELKKKDQENAENWNELEQKRIKENTIFNENTVLKECIKKEKAKRNEAFLKQQIAEKQKEKDEEERLRLQAEKEDTEKQQAEMDLLKKNEEATLMKNKRSALEGLKAGKEAAKKEQEARDLNEAELEIVCGIFRDAKAKMAAALKLKKKQETEKLHAIQDATRQKLLKYYCKKLDNEDQMIAKAIAEQDAAEDLKIQNKKAHDEELVRERKKDYETAMMNDKIKKQNDAEVSKWEMLNRIKQMEVMHEAEKNCEDKRRTDRKKFAELLDKQLEENTKIRQELETPDRAYDWGKNPEKDKKFLEYGEEMLAIQKAGGKPTFPIERTIMKYKKRYGLIVPTESSKSSSVEAAKSHSKEIRLPANTRRICPTKNDSSGVKDCFCN